MSSSSLLFRRTCMDKREAREYVENLLTKIDADDVKCQLIDFYDEFKDEPFEEVYGEDLSEEEIIDIYVETFATDDPKEERIIDEWQKEYNEGILD